ncbi:MAG: hypothetical protein HQL29_05465, partial [Candidatus Omnitrophica bacterium]|nr:hypothetical protein [Candidatus Omnitrophota bacterium]
MKNYSNKYFNFRKVISMVMLIAFFMSAIFNDVSSQNLGMPTDIPIVIPQMNYLKAINTEEFYMPFELGEIVSRYKGNSGKTVIHIQDAH